jgi:hypothetical protein
MTFDPTPIKLNQFVFRDAPHPHPQLGVQVGREFFDRVDETARALGALLGSERAVLLLGERRMGKTSLFRHLIERLKGIDGIEPAPLPPGVALRSADELFSEIVDETAAALGCDEEAAGVFRPGLTAEQQVDALESLCRCEPGTTVVLCIDELDVCLEQQETPAAERAQIAALVDAIVERADLPVKLLCAMIRRPERLPAGAAPRFVSQAARIQLPPFSRGDMDEMLSELGAAHLGRTFSDDDLATVYAASGGWPFFAKLLLISLGEAEAGAERLDVALEQAPRHPAFGEAMAHVFRHYFDRGEKSFVMELARCGGALSPASLTALGPEASVAATSLVGRFFVDLDPDGAYRFRIGLLGPWFRQWSKFAEHSETYRFAG